MAAITSAASFSLEAKRPRPSTSVWCWGGGASARQTVIIKKVRADWQTIPIAFRAGATTDNGRIEIVIRGAGSVRIGAVSLMPADNISGWRKDTVARLRELAATVYRWPGGNFVSGYDWKDGIGDRDRRPPRKNPAWKGRAQRRRTARVHRVVPPHRGRTVHRGQQREPPTCGRPRISSRTPMAETIRRWAGCARRTATQRPSA